MASKPLHVSIGNLNIDITIYTPKIPGKDESIVVEDLTIGPGGSASNYAVAVSCYGHRSVLVASTSSYEYVDRVLKELVEHGVDTRFVKRVEGEPGTVIVIVVESGERIMFRYRGVNEFLSPSDIPRELLEEASIVHLTSISPSIVKEVGERASRLGLLVSYDPGYYVSTHREAVLNALRHVNILFLNRVEAKQLAGARIESLLKHGLEAVVVKKGAGGAYLIQHGGLYYHGVSKPTGNIVNTTGSGDAFDAFFNAAYLDHRDLGKALQYGLAAGTFKAMCRSSTIICDKRGIRRQLNYTSIEVIKNPDEWIIED